MPYAKLITKLKEYARAKKLNVDDGRGKQAVDVGRVGWEEKTGAGNGEESEVRSLARSCLRRHTPQWRHLLAPSITTTHAHAHNEACNHARAAQAQRASASARRRVRKLYLAET